LTLPNIITLFRIALIPLFVYFLIFYNPVQGKFIAAGIFAFLALSDAIDGMLARKFGQVSALGKFLDPLADKFLVVVALLGLTELRIVSSIPVMIIVAREFAVMGFRVHAASKNLNVAASQMAKLKTVLQMIAVLMLILYIPYGALVLWLAVIVSVISGIEYFWNLRGAIYG